MSPPLSCDVDTRRVRYARLRGMAKKRDDDVLPPPEREREAAPRLTVQLTADGTAIAWDRLRESTRDQLTKLGLTVDGSAKPEGPTAEFQFPDAWCDMMLDAVAHLEIALALKLYQGCTIDQAKLLLYSDGEKASIRPALRKVLDKYAGTLLVRYGDEVMLIALLGATAIPKFAKVRADVVQAAEDKAKPQARIVPHVKPESASEM